MKRDGRNGLSESQRQERSRSRSRSHPRGSALRLVKNAILKHRNHPFVSEWNHHACAQLNPGTAASKDVPELTGISKLSHALLPGVTGIREPNRLAPSDTLRECGCNRKTRMKVLSYRSSLTTPYPTAMRTLRRAAGFHRKSGFVQIKFSL